MPESKQKELKQYKNICNCGLENWYFTFHNILTTLKIEKKSNQKTKQNVINNYNKVVLFHKMSNLFIFIFIILKTALDYGLTAHIA